MLSLKNVSKTFAQNTKPALRSIHLELKAGDFCVILGSNGSGKSTLLKIIRGECKAFGGEMIGPGPNDIACVTQDVNLGTVSNLSLLENMVLSCRTEKGLSFYRKKTRQITQSLQKLNLGLESYLGLPLAHLSGGQRQMVAMLMAVAAKPKLLLLDEHTSALDPAMQRLVMQYTATSIQEQQLTTIMVTHNVQDALLYGNRLLMLDKGRVVLDVSKEEKSGISLEILLDRFHGFLGEE